MTGWQRPRSQRLPRGWRRIRLVVLHRDAYRCRIAGPGCAGAATEVDHIVNNDDHTLANLQAVCVPCHRAKTESEKQAGLRRYQSRRLRPQEPHPGSVN